MFPDIPGSFRSFGYWEKHAFINSNFSRNSRQHECTTNKILNVEQLYNPHDIPAVRQVGGFNLVGTARWQMRISKLFGGQVALMHGAPPPRSQGKDRNTIKNKQRGSDWRHRFTNKSIFATLDYIQTVITEQTLARSVNINIPVLSCFLVLSKCWWLNEAAKTQLCVLSLNTLEHFVQICLRSSSTRCHTRPNHPPHSPSHLADL